MRLLSMPYESRILMRDNETLLDVCLETHMSHTGSGDPLREEDLQRNILVLQTAVGNWRQELIRSKRFDDAVLELCRATLAEVAASEKTSESAPVYAVVLRPLVWTEHRKPNSEVTYDHCICDTPLGRFVLTWKSWKSEPWQDMGLGFDQTPWGEVWYDSWHEPDEAKQAAFDDLNRRIALMI